MEKKLTDEIERILEKMKSAEDTIKLREYALTVESLVVSLTRIKK